MSKSRKKVFPKPPQRLNSKTAEKLGERSNQAGYEASIKAIYNQAPRKAELLPIRQRQLDSLKRQLEKRKIKQLIDHEVSKLEALNEGY